MLFDCDKSSANTSLRDILDILTPLESVKFYKQILNQKLEWLNSMRHGNYTNDIVYFRDIIETKYYKTYKMYSTTVLMDDSRNIIQVMKDFDCAIDLLRGLDSETKYSLKKTKIMKEGDLQKFNLYQPIQFVPDLNLKTIIAFRYNKEREMVLKPIQISKRLYDQQINKTKSIYIGNFELSLYGNYAPQYFVFSPRIFSKLLQIEKKLIQLIYYQMGFIQSNDPFNTQFKAYASISDSPLYSDKKQKEGEKLNEVAPTYCDFKGEIIDLIGLKKAYEHVSVAGSTFIKKHKLLFKFVLASQYIEYLDGLQYGLQKVRTPKKNVQYIMREHYQAELELRQSRENKSVIRDMRDTVTNFEVTHAKYNRLIRNELKMCSESLNRSKTKGGCRSNG